MTLALVCSVNGVGAMKRDLEWRTQRCGMSCRALAIYDSNSGCIFKEISREYAVLEAARSLGLAATVAMPATHFQRFWWVAATAALETSEFGCQMVLHSGRCRMG